MELTIRVAELPDIDAVVDVMIADAQGRVEARPGLWRMDADARGKTARAIDAALTAQAPPFRQQWLVAEQGGRIVGVTHSILLPVPPIYAGEFGPPGLIMEGCCVAPDAPEGAVEALLQTAEADLIDAGARILLGSSVPGGVWEGALGAQGYDPLTLYLAKTGLVEDASFAGVRPTTGDDVPGIVGASAEHRRLIAALHPLFWKPHTEADVRFGSWMQRSLTLQDRDMFVAGSAGQVQGYAISQPATPMHFPAPHDILDVGVIDDFYHRATGDPAVLGADAHDAVALLQAAEAARQRRGGHSVMVVCPADWASKIALLEGAGYSTAIVWHIKIIE